MNEHPPIRFGEYMEDFERVVLIGFEKSPDFEIDREVEALGGVVLEEAVRMT
jgi:hypothetical protein